MKDRHSSIRYLPSRPEGAGWGLDLIDIGRQSIGMNSIYPPEEHPSPYYFSPKTGRVLDEYQLLYLTAGNGRFQNAAGASRKISAGDLVILRKGEWHCYHPDLATGWTEHWIGFRGRLAEELVARFVPAGTSVVMVGTDQQILGCFETALAWTRTDDPDHWQVAAAQIVSILSLIRVRLAVCSPSRNQVADKVHRAQRMLLNRMDEPLAMPAIARELGLSYSLFRQAFKRDTGYAPATFLQKIRVNRACDLLRTSNLSLAEVAEVSGFASVYYFSKKFKKETGCSPGRYRQEREASRAQNRC